MTIYLNTLHDICQPLAFCDTIMPGGIAWKALKMAHRFWWFKTRKQKMIEEKDKVELALKAFLQSFIVSNSCATSAAQFVLLIVKIEEIFTAFAESRNTWNAIGHTWRGDYIAGKTSKWKRLLPTIRKIFQYLSSSFCLVMTFVDVIDVAMYSKKTSCEATLLLKNNLVKVRQYCEQSPEAIQRKLYSNKKLIELIVKKTNIAASAEEFIDDVLSKKKSLDHFAHTVEQFTGPVNTVFDWISQLAKTITNKITNSEQTAKLAYTARFCFLEAPPKKLDEGESSANPKKKIKDPNRIRNKISFLRIFEVMVPTLGRKHRKNAAKKLESV